MANGPIRLKTLVCEKFFIILVSRYIWLPWISFNSVSQLSTLFIHQDKINKSKHFNKNSLISWFFTDAPKSWSGGYGFESWLCIMLSEVPLAESCAPKSWSGGYGFESWLCMLSEVPLAEFFAQKSWSLVQILKAFSIKQVSWPLKKERLRSWSKKIFRENWICYRG